MRLIAIVILIIVIVSTNAEFRNKRAAYDLPDGYEYLINSIQQTFTCQSNGYFADVDNGCQLYHVCNIIQHPDGKTEVQQHTFICGNGTIFNQLTFTCSFEEEAVPCQSAPDFFYLNDAIGVPNQPFLTDSDVDKAALLISSRESRPVRRPASRPVIQSAQVDRTVEEALPITGSGLRSVQPIRQQTLPVVQAPVRKSPARGKKRRPAQVQRAPVSYGSRKGY